MIKIRTNEELKKVSEHLLYEIPMLNGTSQLSNSDKVKNNAFVESFRSVKKIEKFLKTCDKKVV